MQKFLICILFLSLSSTLLLSQNRNVTKSVPEIKPFRSLSTPAGIADTIHYFTDPGAFYTATDGGYVAGTNVYGDVGKYQRFDFDEGITLTGLIAVFGEKGVVGEPDSINFVIKALGTEEEPGTTHLSKVITTNELDTTDFTYISLSPLQIEDSSSVFIGFEWTSAVDDSFGLVSDDDGGGDGANRAWEKWSDGQYFAFNSGEDSWELDVDLWIGAIVETITGVEIISPSGFRLNQNYPNPFNPNTRITFTLGVDSKVILKIYNILGEEITTLADKVFPAGPHFVNFNASNLNSGIYFYELKSEGYDGTIRSEVKKMVLTK
jgi:hypothetical protein